MVPNTLFMGQQQYFLPTCDSTNTEAQKLLNKNEATEGCVVLTAQQTKGRGQRGNNWEAEPGKNITLSVILSPSFLLVRQQFYLNMAVSLAVLDLVREQGLIQGQVKWPNDLYVQDRKLGGILIENTISNQKIQQSIVGIGLNINQTNFSSPTATSLAAILERELDLDSVVAQLMEYLEKRYLELRAGRLAKIKFDYLRALYRYQEPHLFVVNGEQVPGQIQGVDEEGKLAVEVAQELRFFGFKEIGFVI
ncbi:biotin--[acetyl-CoA-carboxylase] ligase [Pontibacter qinzhouensis]|uniref:Biotin--[acetyl-CoA-carboxylase] ligase n=1 Tax=Pontibacter qinzhouensis TaxID=2603253 RepID=A0A5C8KE52_9BACT|nr:biotin--[acetyl-CoA-carboxylase] ligase [Pontibacter qinzhouensis]TXK51600.1 biotin--[acetyl-CoA-carboxylase] ligase [Pontibacter qinzhouensis]